MQLDTSDCLYVLSVLGNADGHTLAEILDGFAELAQLSPGQLTPSALVLLRGNRPAALSEQVAATMDLLLARELVSLRNGRYHIHPALAGWLAT